MDSMSSQAFELLNELVLDDGETVTFRRLASTLCLHVNRSKKILQQFVEKHAKSSNLKVSTLICGSNNDGNARTVLCSDEQLNNVRNSFKSVLFEHIYAVGRSNVALEETTLVNSHAGFDDFTQTIGVISSKNCVKLSNEEIGNLKSNSYKTLTQDTVTAAKPHVNDKNKTKLSSNGISEDIKNTTTINKGLSHNEVTKEKTIESTVRPKDENKLKVQPKNNISSFFSKQNGHQTAKTVKNNELINSAEKVENPSIKDAKLPVQSVKVKVENKNSQEEESKIKESNLATPDNKKFKQQLDKKTEKDDKKKPKKENTNLNKNKAVTSKNGKVDKKRKRVLQLSDSEDSDKDDPFEEPPSTDIKIDSDEDIIPATPNMDVVKITSGILNSRKRRKIVDKTYTTEDGYMVTRKEEVLESCSEDEADTKESVAEVQVKKEIVIEKKTPVAKTKKKLPSPQKGKQASIMNFFKKK